MPRRKRSLEAGPTGGLRLIAATEGFEYVEPRVFPFKAGPAASPMLCRLYGLPSFVGSTRAEEALCYISGDVRRPPDRFLILRDVRVNVALSIRDVLQSQSNGANARVLGDLIRIDR